MFVDDALLTPINHDINLVRAVPNGEALVQHFTGALCWTQVIHDAVAKLTFIN